MFEIRLGQFVPMCLLYKTSLTSVLCRAQNLRRLKTGREASWPKKNLLRTPHQRPSILDILVKGQAHGLLQRQTTQTGAVWPKTSLVPLVSPDHHRHQRQSPPALATDHCSGTFSAKATSKTSSKWVAKCTWMFERTSQKTLHLHRCNCWPQLPLSSDKICCFFLLAERGSGLRECTVRPSCKYLGSSS